MLSMWIVSRFKAAGPMLAAVAIVVGAVMIMGLLIGGLWWLRADAARDARAAAESQCTRDRLLANNEAIEEQRRVDNEAAAAAHHARTAWITELDAARARVADLEAQLKLRPERVVCYPKAVARELAR